MNTTPVPATPAAVSIPEAVARLRAGEVSAAELAEAALAAIDGLDGELRSFALTDREGARAAARDADVLLREGRGGPLTGVPIGMKDIVHMKRLPTRCGSPAFSSSPRAADAHIVRLLREAGAVIVGKTTAHELACGVYSPPAVNPWDAGRIPGGSSGGSGAAVAAGLVPMAVGSDTGGSIRIPAALCGVAGLKPTYGRVSRSGAEPLSWSLDHFGPLAATVRGCAVSLGAMAGPDPADPTTASAPPVPDYQAGLERGVAGMRAGVLAGAPFAPMQEDVEEAFWAAVDVLRGLEMETVETYIPELEAVLPAEFAIVGAEAAARHRKLLRERPDLIDPGIRGLLTAGTLMPGSHYMKGLQARLVIRDALRRTFEEHRLDVMLTPTLPAVAAGLEQEEFVYGSETESVTFSYVRTTAPFNLSGLPALSVPGGFDRAGLPIGLQIAGRPFAEETVLRAGFAYEKSTDWSQRTPPVHSSRLPHPPGN